MVTEKRGIGWWIQRAGPVERVVAGALAVIFVVGILLIVDGLVSQSGLVRHGAYSGGQQFSETGHRDPVSN